MLGFLELPREALTLVDVAAGLAAVLLADALEGRLTTCGAVRLTGATIGSICAALGAASIIASVDFAAALPLAAGSQRPCVEVPATNVTLARTHMKCCGRISISSTHNNSDEVR